MPEVFDFIKNVLEGWQVTVAASVIIAAIIIIALAIWSAMRWRYGGVVKNKDAAIQTKDATIQTLEATINLAKTKEKLWPEK
jgi:hypothetical protein